MDFFFFSQSFGICYGSHYGMNSAIKQQGHLPLLCFYKPTVVHFVSSFSLSHSSSLLSSLVVKLCVMTSLKQTLSIFFLSVLWPLPLVEIFAFYPSAVCINMLSPDVIGSFCHLHPIWSTFASKWQKRKEFIIQSLHPKPDVGRYIKAKLRQQNSCWYIVLREESERHSEFCLFF